MLFYCPTVQANFPTEKLRLANLAPARLVWDEHGGTFVLRVEGLEVIEAPELQGEAEIRLEVALPPPTTLARQIEGFAGQHALRLNPGPPRVEFSETAVLAAVHIPGKKVFIFCEEPRLTVRRRETQVMELWITGAFKSRRVPCQETDAVIHLEAAVMGRLLAGLLAWALPGKWPGAG